MVKIVTDSSCDLSPKRCAELGVDMLPITVNFGEESYRANIDISNEEFYEKLAAAEELPHTAQITPAQFQEIFMPYKESGDDVVCLFISSKMSGTLQSARVAANILGAENILLPDTLHVTFALGLLVEEAVKMRDAGLSGPQIVEKIQELIPRIRLFAMIEDLKYLKMGGRLSATSALVASILGICPIITLKDGLVEVVGKARGKKAAFAAIRKFVEKDLQRLLRDGRQRQRAGEQQGFRGVYGGPAEKAGGSCFVHWQHCGHPHRPGGRGAGLYQKVNGSGPTGPLFAQEGGAAWEKRPGAGCCGWRWQPWRWRQLRRCFWP